MNALQNGAQLAQLVVGVEDRSCELRVVKDGRWRVHGGAGVLDRTKRPKPKCKINAILQVTDQSRLSKQRKIGSKGQQRLIRKVKGQIR